jgi:hypothetical protein
MAGYSGFRTAEDVPVGNESPGLIGIEVKLKGPAPVLSEISFPPMLAHGSTGSFVSALQKALKEFCGPNTPTDPGAIDGNLGSRTESAVRTSIATKHYSRWDCRESDVVGSGRSSWCHAGVVSGPCLAQCRNPVALPERWSNHASALGLQIPQRHELWGLCNVHLLFHRSHNARLIFCSCHVGTTCKGAA